MLIAGSFREYPFSLLLEIFLRRRETGLLEVSSTKDSGYFYIKNGKVKDGQIGKNTGSAAVNLVAKLDDGSFQFKPLAPSDYARIVWQQNFGPIGAANVASSTREVLLQFFVYTLVTLHGRRTVVLFLLRRCVASGCAFWKRAQLKTRLLRLKQGLTVAQHRRRRDRHLSSRYRRHVRFRAPSLITHNVAVVPGAVQQGIAGKVVFAFILTLLLGTSGLMLRQLVVGEQDLRDAGTANQHTDIPINASPTRAKSMRHRHKRPRVNKSKTNSRDRR